MCRRQILYIRTVTRNAAPAAIPGDAAVNGMCIARFFTMARAKRGERRIVVAVLPDIGAIGPSERRAIVRELRSGKRKPPLHPRRDPATYEHAPLRNNYRPDV